jgi:ubiquitin-protein ligase
VIILKDVSIKKLPIEEYLIKLSSYVEPNRDDLDNDIYINMNEKILSSNHKVWKNGTGYGHSKAPDWDIKSYIKSQEEKDKQIEYILNQILEELYNITDDNSIIIYKCIKNSYLISYIKNQLLGITMLEINKHLNIYKQIMIILQNFANEKSIYLFEISDDTNVSLYEICNNVYKTIININKINKVEPDEISNMIINLFEMIDPIYQKYIKEQENGKKEDKKDKISDETNLNEENIYNTQMEQLKFDEAQIENTNYHYQQLFESNKDLPITNTKRIIQEYTTLMQSIPIHYKASIFVRIDPNNMRMMRFLITGPEKTPYECGCFLFDMYITKEFPQKPPLVNFLNTGGQRFNPNLYNCGKVCLSILGTWAGSISEQWNEKTSSLFQILMSIQSQILIEEPYYNEPGHENKKSTNESNNYNQKVRLYTMKHAILDLIKEPSKYPQFTEVIKQHFKIRKNKILEICNDWTLQSNSSDYNKINKEIINFINKL